jgi:hypothetical protein
MRKLPTGHDLIDRAKSLGVYYHADHEQIQLGAEPSIMAAIAPLKEIQDRVLAAEKYLRDRRLWVFALISAIASVFSALAAWCAVIFR